MARVLINLVIASLALGITHAQLQTSSSCASGYYACQTNSSTVPACYSTSQYCCVSNVLYPASSSQCFLAVPPPVPASATVIRTSAFCTPYGDVPQQVVDESVPGVTLAAQGEICLPIPGAKRINITVATRQRTACLYVNLNASTSNPLPLLVWAQPSLTPIAGGLYVTGLLDTMYTKSLNNANSSAIGYHILTVGGLFGTHNYPTWDRVGLGWDNWYRNTNRSDPALNADVAAHDAFISAVNSTGLVDPYRIYLSGWSNGASFAIFYAMSTGTVAAAAVYSAPDAYRDVGDRCPNIPNPQYATPTLDMHNYCDIVGTCITGKYFYDDMAYRYPQKKTNLTIISYNTTYYPIMSTDHNAQCDPTCSAFDMVVNYTAQRTGQLAHERYPVDLNYVLLDYMYDNPLPASGMQEYIGAPINPYPNVIANLSIPYPLLEYTELYEQTVNQSSLALYIP